MSIYGDLMALNKVQQTNRPETKTPIKDGPASPTAKSVTPIRQPKNDKTSTVIPRHHDTTTPSMVSRHHDTIIELIRSAVKTFGKEAATHRFTPEEKKAIADVVYTYKIQGVKTSENEVARIAINFIVHEYKENGEASVLHRAIKALNDTTIPRYQAWWHGITLATTVRFTS